MHPAADREPYRVPRYVTEAGLEAFHREVTAYARKLSIELTTICIAIATLGPPIVAGLTSPSTVAIWTSWGFLALAVVGVALLWFTRAGRSRSPR